MLLHDQLHHIVRDMSYWQSEPLQYGSSAACNVIRSDENTHGPSEQLLSSEKRDMLVHYFSHRGKASVSQHKQPIRQEVRSNMEVGLVTRRHQNYFCTPHMFPSREWPHPADNYPLVER